MLDICWSSILLIRRIALLLLHTYNQEAVSRQTLMLTVAMVALLIHLTAWPCKERRANFAGIVSNVALVTVCIINLMRATFEVAQFLPFGEVQHFMAILDFVEHLLLFWVPLAGMCVIICVLSLRTIAKIISLCSRQQIPNVTSFSLSEANISAIQNTNTINKSNDKHTKQ